jgi:hypothetical protein
MEVEDEVKFAHISKIFIQDLNKALHEFEHDQLIFILIDDGDEVETGISLVHYLVLLVVQEVAHLRVTGYY